MKTLKKSLALLLALVMSLGCMSVGAWASDDDTPDKATVEADGSAYTKLSEGLYQDNESYSSAQNFYITSKDGLFYFQKIVNGDKETTETVFGNVINAYQGNIFTGKTVHLLTDIDLENISWTPIGYVHGQNDESTFNVDKMLFYGNFDGHNHTISNITVSESSNNSKGEYGFFGRIGAPADKNQTIKNLTLDNITVSGGSYVGAFVGNCQSNPVTFEYCYVTGDISLTGYYTGAIYGIGNGNVTNCTVNASKGSTITGYYFAGGLVGAERCAQNNNLSVTGNNVSGVAISGNLAGKLVGSPASGAAGTLTITGNTVDESVAVSGTHTDDYICEKVQPYTTVIITDRPVAQIGETKYTTLAEAVDAVESNATITLIGNISNMETVEIPQGKEITLDLNGHSIAAGLKQEGRHYYAIDNYGNFTLKDSVGGGIITARGLYNKSSDATTTIESGEIFACDNNGGAAIFMDGGTVTVNGGTLRNGAGTNGITEKSGTVTVNGGQFIQTYAGSVDDNSGPACIYSLSDSSLTITGGSFTSQSQRAYTIIADGSLTITPAETKTVTVSGKHGALSVDSGNAVINGGTFACENYYGLWITNNGENTNVTVNGGTFSGGRYGLYASVDDGKQDASDASITITGGTFSGTQKGAVTMNGGSSERDWGMTITGGTFSTDPSAYVADGYVAVKTGEVWVVTQLKPADEGNQTTTTNSTSETKVTNPETSKTTATTTDTTVEQTLTSDGTLVSKTTTTEDLATTTDVNNVVTEVKYTATKAETVGETSTETVASATVKSETKAGDTELSDTDAAALAEKASNTIPADQVALAEELKETAETYKAQNPAAEKVEVEVILEIRTTLTDYEAGNKVTYEVAPWKTTVVKVDDQTVEAEPAAQKVANTELSKNAEITIRLPIPNDFSVSAGDKIYVKHSSEGYDDAVIEANVVNNSGTLYAVFQVAHFSSFEILPKGTTYYTVSFDNVGDSSVNVQKVASGSTAVQPTAPTRSGYTFSGWTLSGSAYNFATPVTGDITLDAQWTRNSTGSYTGGGSYTPPTTTITDEETPLSEFPIFYVDVAEDSWYHDAIAYVTALDLMNGVGDNRFSPNANTTRGMVAVVMMRLAQGVVIDSASFFDVADDAYYAEAAAWAVENGVYVGFDDGSFRGELNITREQFAAVLYRYATAKGYDVSGKAELGSFTDSASVSGYAADAMAWAVESGIIEGVGDNLLDPLGNATRAQLATMLMRFHALYTAEV